MTTIQIKKDGQDPQIINVPEGAKIIIEDGITIVEPEFKYGDFIFDQEHSSVQIYSGSGFVIAQLFLNSNNLYLSGRSVSKLSNARHATESEKQLLFDAIAKYGMQWNPETKQIEELKSKFNELGYEYNFETHTAEKLRWFPKKGETYYYPDQFCYSLYRSAINDTDSFDKKCIELKLAFKTPEEAIKCTKKMLSCL